MSAPSRLFYSNPCDSMLASGELRAAYLSKERFIADIMEIAGNMKECDRFIALLVMRALELGQEVVGIKSPTSRKERRITL